MKFLVLARFDALESKTNCREGPENRSDLPFGRRNIVHSAWLASFIVVLGLALPTEAADKNKAYTTVTCSDVASGLSLGGKREKTDKNKSIQSLQGKWVKWNATVIGVCETLWGVEVRVTCSHENKEVVDATLSFESASKQDILRLSKGQQINFSGQITGYSEVGGISIVNAELAATLELTSSRLQRPVPASQSPAVPTQDGPTQMHASQPAGILDQLSKRVQLYFNMVQLKNIDSAIDMYSAVKRPNIKRQVLESTARDTQYYRIDRIDPITLDASSPRVKVYLYHKKINQPEEYWEVDMEFVNEMGEWRIRNTPGRRLR